MFQVHEIVNFSYEDLFNYEQRSNKGEIILLDCFYYSFIWLGNNYNSQLLKKLSLQTIIDYVNKNINKERKKWKNIYYIEQGEGK